MKRVFCLLLVLVLAVIVFGGCDKNSDYVKSDDNDELTVSIPEFSNKTDERVDSLSEEELKFVGVWRLNVIQQPGVDSMYKRSYYVFYNTGAFYLIINGEHLEGTFYANDGILQLADTTRLRYVINGDELQLETVGGTKHHLTRISKEPPDRLTITQDSMVLDPGGYNNNP